jgi:hypothetical protein
MIQITKTILFIVILAVLIVMYEKYNMKAINRIKPPLSPPPSPPPAPAPVPIIEKYIFNKNKHFHKKPFIWLHVDYDINARKWLDFGSRNSRNLNRPYIQICLQQNIKLNSDDFNIVIIDDTSFKDLIPGWNIDLFEIAEPTKIHIRILALIKLLYHYGGLLCPISFFPMKKFLPIYNKYDAFVFRTLQRYDMYNSYVPSITFIAGKKNNVGIKNLMNHIESLEHNDFYNNLYFFKNVNRHIIELTDKKEITIIDGKINGVKTNKNENIYIHHLVENSEIKLSQNAIGLYIPQEDLEERTNYNWITYLSQRELMNSNTFIGKLFKTHTIENGAPAPNIGAPTPNVGAPTPNVGAMPTVSAPTPNVGAPNPNVGAPNPNVGAPNPNPVFPPPTMSR